MGFRNTLDPYGGRAPLIDRFIGNAYQAVRHVADHIQEIRYVVTHMQAITSVAKGLRKTALVEGVVGSALPSNIVMPLPDGVISDKLLSSSVLIHAANGNVYGIESGTFYATIVNGALRVTILSGAPSLLVQAKVRWHVTYEA